MPSNTRPTRWNTSCITAADRDLPNPGLTGKGAFGRPFLSAPPARWTTRGAYWRHDRHAGQKHGGQKHGGHREIPSECGSRPWRQRRHKPRNGDTGKTGRAGAASRPKGTAQQRRVQRSESNRTAYRGRGPLSAMSEPRAGSTESPRDRTLPRRAFPRARPRRTPVVPPHAEGARPAGRAPLQCRKLRADQSRPISRQTAGTASAASASFSASPSRKGVTPQARIGWSQP